MKSVNKVILLGNLTRDPEMVQSEEKHAKCSFGLATNRNWTSYTGEKHEETTCQQAPNPFLYGTGR